MPPEKANEYTYDWENHTPFTTQYPIFSMPVSTDFDPLPEEAGTVAMSEASGIAYSVKNPGKIWAHNDSGHPNTLFLLDAATGEIVARYNVNGTNNIDWEDIEVSVGPIEGESYLYVSDTGDNNKRRASYSIYRFIEPTYEASHYGHVITVTDIVPDQIKFTYPDGSYDAEALFVDPFTKDIYLATKRDVVSTLYAIPYPQKVGEPYPIFKAGEFAFRESSAGTVSADGTKVLIKNRQDIFYWERNQNESMLEMLARTPIKVPYIGEPQGEAICFDPENNYYTLSEALNSETAPMLYKYNYKF